MQASKALLGYPTLSNLTQLQRADIARQICTNPRWPHIGLHFNISRDLLVATYGDKPNLFLCEHLIERLAEKLVSIEAFTKALEAVELVAVAQQIKANYVQDYQQLRTAELITAPTNTGPKNVMNKFLVIPNNQRLSEQLDKLLHKMEFKLSSKHNQHSLWKFSSEDHTKSDCFIMKLVGAEPTRKIYNALQLVGGILFIVVLLQGKEQELSEEQIHRELKHQPTPAKSIFKFLLHSLKEEFANHIKYIGYGMSHPNVDYVPDNGDLMHWMIADVPRKSSKGINLDITVTVQETKTTATIDSKICKQVENHHLLKIIESRIRSHLTDSGYVTQKQLLLDWWATGITPFCLLPCEMVVEITSHGLDGPLSIEAASQLFKELKQKLPGTQISLDGLSETLLPHSLSLLVEHWDLLSSTSKQFIFDVVVFSANLKQITSPNSELFYLAICKLLQLNVVKVYDLENLPESTLLNWALRTADAIEVLKSLIATQPYAVKWITKHHERALCEAANNKQALALISHDFIIV